MKQSLDEQVFVPPSAFINNYIDGNLVHAVKTKRASLMSLIFRVSG